MIRRSGTKRLQSFCTLIALCTLPLFAEEALPSGPSGGSIEPADLIVFAGTLFTGVEFLEHVLIVIRDGSVSELVPGSSIEEAEKSAGATTPFLNAGDSTVLPGFVDAHVRFSDVPDAYTINIDRYGFGRAAEESISLMAGNREGFLRHGVTSAIDAESDRSLLKRIRKRGDRGELLAPMITETGPVVVMTRNGRSSFGNRRLFDRGAIELHPEDDPERIVRTASRNGTASVRVLIDDGSVGTKRAAARDTELGPPGIEPGDVAVAGLVREARRLGVPVFAEIGPNAEEAAAAVAAGANGIDGSFLLGAERFADGGGDQALLEAMASESVVFTPLLARSARRNPDLLPEMMRTVLAAFRAGVPIAAGSGFPESDSLEPGSDLYRELALLEAAGLPRDAVLRAVTSVAGRKTGRMDAGVIVKGGIADFVMMRGDARHGALGRERVETVILDGRIVARDLRIVSEERDRFERSAAPFPIPIGYWSPETSAVFGLMASHFNVLGTGTSVMLMGMYSLTRSMRIMAMINPPSPIPRTALMLSAYADTFDEEFYGADAPSPDDDTVYEKSVIMGKIEGTTRLVRPFKLLTGVSVESHSYSADDVPSMNLPESEAYVSTTFTLGLAYDTRDREADAWSGFLAQLLAEVSPSAVGTNGDFSILTLDTRLHAQLLRNHHVAFRALGMAGIGEVPFSRLPSFGGITLGRGYAGNRFPGRFLAAGQAEYRFGLFPFLQLVLFTDAGFTGDDISTLLRSDLAYSGGAGIRFMPGGDFILSLDAGYSPEGWQTSFRFGQAF